jgi:hypothetical protein
MVLLEEGEGSWEGNMEYGWEGVWHRLLGSVISGCQGARYRVVRGCVVFGVYHYLGNVSLLEGVCLQRP